MCVSAVTKDLGQFISMDVACYLCRQTRPVIRYLYKGYRSAKGDCVYKVRQSDEH